MKEILLKIRKAITVGMICSLCMVFGSITESVHAEELIGVFEEEA